MRCVAERTSDILNPTCALERTGIRWARFAPNTEKETAMKNSTKDTNKLMSAVLGTAFVTAVSAAGVNAAENPFASAELNQGYKVAAHHEGKCGEGKCGEGKCGAKADEEGKCGEGKCGAKSEKEGKCGEGKCGAKSEKEGKCGEGKCGGKKES